MKVFKFGGASVKDAKSIMAVANILKSEKKKDLVVLISAMGKMTNAFEKITDNYYNNNNDLNNSIHFVKEYHYSIIEELFKENHPIYPEVERIFIELTQFLINNKISDYNYIYDQIVGYGEILSTKIISLYCNEIGVKNNWLDSHKLIKTDANYRNAKIDWESTEKAIKKIIKSNTFYITQGFIAGTDKAFTTLGREGSDYSAAIFAYCINAKSLTIWKDVPGVYNADPRFFKDKTLLREISYKEALEMAFYGASIIHPKTIKPLENKNIPLFVRSFNNIKSPGTIIKKGCDLNPKTACYTLKEKQILLSISSKDFSFMIEQNISHIFKLFTLYKIKVNLIQNSAISFSVCIEDSYNLFESLYQKLLDYYLVTYNNNVKLITIRHFNDDDISQITNNYTVLLTQQTSKTVQFIVK